MNEFGGEERNLSSRERCVETEVGGPYRETGSRRVLAERSIKDMSNEFKIMEIYVSA